MTNYITLKNNNRLNTLATRLQVIGDANRLKIVCAIHNHAGICVSEISKSLNLHIATVSHHLQTLSKAGLLTQKRAGKKICYSLSNNSFIKDLKYLICKCK